MVSDYQNGVEIFLVMLVVICQVQCSVNLEIYIYWLGDIFKEFIVVLIECVCVGVKVCVLVDWVGFICMKFFVVEVLCVGGVCFEYFYLFKWYSLDCINNCIYCKLLIVDGCIVFNGGVGIVDVWDGYGDNFIYWCDMQFCVEGLVVQQM